MKFFGEIKTELSEGALLSSSFILYDEINDTINTYINFQNKYYEISYYNYTFKKLYIDNDLFKSISLTIKFIFLVWILSSNF